MEVYQWPLVDPRLTPGDSTELLVTLADPYLMVTKEQPGVTRGSGKC